MTISAVVVIALILAVVVCVIYALRNGYGVKTATKWWGGSFTFEAQKPDAGASKSPAPTTGL
jgi:hypothetical protein